MANGNPFSIVPVDIPGVFGAVQQFKQNALNLEIGQEKLNAFRQDREQKGRVRQLQREAVKGSEAAKQELLVLDMTFIKGLEEFERNAAADALDEVVRLSKRGLADPSSIPAALNEAIEKFPDIEDQLPEGFLDLPFEQQKPILEGFVAQGLNGAELLRNPDQFEDVLDDEGNLIGQRDTETNKFIPIPGDANIRPPSGFRFIGENLEAIPGGPGERQQKSLDLQTSRAIMQQVAAAFGGFFNPATGAVGGLDKNQTDQYLETQVRAHELLESGDADNVAEAVQGALGEVRGKEFIQGEFDEDIAEFFDEKPKNRLKDEEKAKLHLGQATRALAAGADAAAVLRLLKKQGVTRKQVGKSGLIDALKKSLLAFVQLKNAGIL